MSKKLYRVRRGIGFNDDAYVVTNIPGDWESLKFLTHLKKIIDTEKGFVGLSLDTIITGVAGHIGFHKEEDYKYFMSKAKKTYKNDTNEN